MQLFKRIVSFILNPKSNLSTLNSPNLSPEDEKFQAPGGNEK